MCYILTKVHFVIKKIKISPKNEQTHFFVFTQINFYFNRPKYPYCRSVQTDAYLLLYSYMVFFVTDPQMKSMKMVMNSTYSLQNFVKIHEH